jgi:hypothetical protein
MNGLEFACCTTAGGIDRVLVHAAPPRLSVEVRTADGDLVVRADADREGDYSPMTLLTRDGGSLTRAEVWPTADHHGLPVLLAGGEAGVLQAWRHAGDRSWWRWSVEFANHVDAPPDWTPPAH